MKQAIKHLYVIASGDIYNMYIYICNIYIYIYIYVKTDSTTVKDLGKLHNPVYKLSL